MKLMRVCRKNVERANKLAKDLSARWVSENVLASNLRPAMENVSLNSVIQLEFGGNVVYTMADATASFRANMQNQTLHWDGGPVPAAANRIVSIITDVKDFKKRDFNVAVAAGINGATVRVIKLVNCYGYDLGEREMSALCCLIFRKYFRIYLPQFMRNLHTFLITGIMNATTLLAAAQNYGDKFVIAAIKLAIGGFKGKRFKQRALVVGENVRAYYDGFSLGQVRQKLLIGTVATISPSYITLSDGRTFQYMPKSGIATVWPTVY